MVEQKDRFIVSVKVGPKGQITLPKEAREMFQLGRKNAAQRADRVDGDPGILVLDAHADISVARLPIQDAEHVLKFLWIDTLSVHKIDKGVVKAAVILVGCMNIPTYDHQSVFGEVFRRFQLPRLQRGLTLVDQQTAAVVRPIQKIDVQTPESVSVL